MNDTTLLILHYLKYMNPAEIKGMKHLPEELEVSVSMQRTVGNRESRHLGYRRSRTRPQNQCVDSYAHHEK